MPPLISESNGGPASLLGRGLAHRHLDPEQRAHLAAGVAAGLYSLIHSHGQLCSLFHVTPPMLRKHITAIEHVAAEKNDNGQVPVAVIPEISIRALTDRLAVATPAERFAIVQALDVLWDAFVKPVIDAQTNGNG